MRHFLVRLSSGLVLASTICMLTPSAAKAAINVDTMDIDVLVEEDGSAVITQNWTTYVDDGTEYYLYYKDSGYLEFDDLTVSDDTQEYENIGDWDIDADFEEKAYKCGINPVDDGVELCWGISEYGSNHYTISYTIENLAASYADGGVGIFYRFVNGGMEFFPTDVTLTIHMADGTPLSADNAAIWGFGYDGDVVFEDGSITAGTNSALVDDENITLLISLDSTLLNPVYVMDDDLQSVIDYAMEDSSYADEYFGDDGYDDYDDGYYEDDDYYGDDDWDDGYGFDLFDTVFIVPVLFIAGVIFLSLIKDIRKNKQQKKANDLESSCSYYNAVPNGGEIDATYVLARAAGKCEYDAIMGAHFLNLMLAGAVEDIPDEKNPNVKNLLLHPDVFISDSRDRELFDFLSNIPARNMYITGKQMNHYCDKHYEEMDAFIRHCKDKGNRWLKNHGCLHGSTCKSIDDLTEEGILQLTQVLGLHKYLKEMANLSAEDFNLNNISSEELDRMNIWKELLPYTILFNCSEEYEAGMQAWYPDYYEMPIWQHYYMTSRMSRHYYHRMHTGRVNGHARADAVSSSSSAFGGGGGASFGGGGGFSGGGGGGHR